MSRPERGSASLLAMAALGFATILAAFSADLARASAARGVAQTAADAAALAAAQEMAIPTGADPSEMASAYALRNSASLVACRCEVGAREALATVEVRVELPFLGQTRTIRATARAVVEVPPGAEQLRPSFVVQLVCLLDRVPGVWIVSGFRTHAEQAALYRRKPDLAAPPGHSMHELGLAADLGYPSASARAAAHAAAPECGLDFPVDGEPWHVEPAA
jgi:secretion/DNA translocation related TadE-like protein